MQSFNTLKQVVHIEALDFKALSVFYLFIPSFDTFMPYRSRIYAISIVTRERLCKVE